MVVAKANPRNTAGTANAQTTGASGMMAGPLLTLPGGSADDDLQMIHDLGFVADRGKPAADAR